MVQLHQDLGKVKKKINFNIFEDKIVNENASSLFNISMAI